MMGGKAKLVDWAAVEIDYRCGIKTLRTIGLEHGISHVFVLKHARAEGWTRDLSAKIKARADDLLAKAAIPSKVTEATEKQVVDANASLQSAIQLVHRKDIAQAREIVQKLFAELRRATEKSYDLATRAMIVQRLTGAQATLIEKERQAVGIDKAGEIRQSFPEWLAANG